MVEVAENEGFMDDDEDIVNYAKNHGNLKKNRCFGRRTKK
jgi:hypothetical protein